MSKAKLIKLSEAKVVDLGSKKIIKHTSEDRSLEVNHMKITGKHPEESGHYVFEKEVHFMLFVINGTGKVYCDKEVFTVEVGDVVDVPAQVKFAVEGDFESLALQSPAWSPNQAYIVDIQGNVLEETKK